VPVPNHLRNAPTATHKAEGAAKGYKYPHDYPGHFVSAEYLPAGFEKSQFYRPGDLGQESKIKERLRDLWPDRKYD
jgi:putative ATPase